MAHPDEKMLQKAWERPRQFLDWFARQPLQQMIGEGLEEERKTGTAILDAMLLYSDEQVKKVQPTYTLWYSRGVTWYGPVNNREESANIGGLAYSMFCSMPSGDGLPYYKLHRSLTEYVEAFEQQEAQAS